MKPRGWQPENVWETLSFTVHVKILQKFVTEIYKSLNNMNPSIVLEFHEKNVGNMILEKRIFA